MNTKTSRAKRLFRNTVFSFALQLTNIGVSFILPKLFLASYGSSVNGLISSVSQFLQVIAFLDLGIGAVICSSFYKPLADGDNRQLSSIVASGNRFFNRIGAVLGIYTLILTFVYPLFINREFPFAGTAVLVVVISIGFFAQHYLGIVDHLLLSADQKSYIYSIVQICTVVANMLVCVVSIKLGASVQTVKFLSSLVFIARPVILRIYINRHYSIDRRIKYEGEPIKQKWNGIGQHVASAVLEYTDTIVLTLFSTLSMVSVYSIYHMVVYGVKVLLISLTTGIQSLLGEMWAKREEENLRRTFSGIEWLINFTTVLIYGCTAFLIVSFVQVYTRGITDADYVQPVFAALIVAANGIHCLRLPYHLIIRACGQYKETQNNYLVAAAINIVVSVIAVNLWDLVGVAVGTLAAMLYQTVGLARFCYKNILKIEIRLFVKQVCTNVLSIGLCVLATMNISISALTYPSWILTAFCKFCISLAIVGFVNYLFYKEQMLLWLGSLKRRLVKKQSKNRL